jgi:hypothetical protein
MGLKIAPVPDEKARFVGLRAASDRQKTRRSRVVREPPYRQPVDTLPGSFHNPMEAAEN